MHHLLEAVEFRDPLRARREIDQLFDPPDPVIHSQMEALLLASPDIDRVLFYLVSLKQQHPAEFERFCSVPGILRALVAVFSYSRFLSDELLQNPGWLETMERLDQGLSREHYTHLLEEFLGFLTHVVTT